jgi:hypothetical protein
VVAATTAARKTEELAGRIEMKTSFFFFFFFFSLVSS